MMNKRLTKNLPKGKPLIPNAGIARWYARTLKAYVKAMRKTIEPQILQFFKDNAQSRTYAQDADISDLDSILSDAQNASEQVFNDISEQLSLQLFERIEQASEKSLENSLSSLFVDYQLQGIPLSPELQEVIQAGIADNVNYIHSISDEYFKRIIGEVMRTVTQGGSISSLTNKMFSFLKKSLQKIGEGTERRAQLIAQDQTRKAFTSINKAKMKAAGVKKFIWIHSGGGKTSRPYHKYVLNGKTFSMDDPPIIDPKTEQTGFPADLPYCKCVMQPVIDLEPDDED